MILSFEDLTLHVPQRGGCGSLNARNIGRDVFGINSLENQEAFDAFRGVSGWVKTGEIVLLIGPSQCGKSSLLRTLSGRCNRKLEEVYGSVMIDGVKVSMKQLRNNSVFVADKDDSHLPNFTVRECFKFAARCFPSSGSQSVDHVLELLQLQDVADVIIGDKETRGISGGQKRRVTLGEMLFRQTPFLFLDQVTNGLDAITAFHIIKEIKEICRMQDRGAIVCLEAPGNDIVNMFDRVMAMQQDGQVLYFGDPKNVLQSLCKVEEAGRTDLLISDVIIDASRRGGFGPPSIELPREGNSENEPMILHGKYECRDYVAKSIQGATNVLETSRAAILFPDYVLRWHVFTDIPLNLLEAVLISAVTYSFVQGLNPDGFPFFLGTLIGMEFVGSSLARVISLLSPTEVFGNAMSTTILTFLASLAGFMPSYLAIPVYFRWISWINPCAYAFEGIMLNQYEGMEVPGLTIFDNITIGGMSGSQYLTTYDLPRPALATWSFNSVKALDIGFLFLFTVVMDSIGMFLIRRRSNEWYGFTARKEKDLWRYSPILRKTRTEKRFEKENPGEVTEETQVQVGTADTNHLLVRNMKYTVKKNKTLLENINLDFQSREMYALMGPSGAGKTTLLDVIAQMKNTGQVADDSKIVFNGIPLTAKSRCGYAEQNDILPPFLSVEEAILFAAKLKLSGKSQRQLRVIVKEAMERLELLKYAKYAIGRDGATFLSRAVRKRIAIAIELVGEPKVLFLDEPTTGMNSTDANDTMKTVQELTKELNLITIVTIHQPSRKLFELFDEVVLLIRGGKLAYAGPIGPNSETVLSHFQQPQSALALADEGQTIPKVINPADFLISAIENMDESSAAASSSSSSSSAVPLSSEALMKQQQQQEQTGEQDRMKQDEEIEKMGGKRSIRSEFKFVFLRHLVNEGRDPNSTVRLAISFFGALMLGLLFLNAGRTRDINAAVLIIASIFYSVFLFVIPMQSVVVGMVEQRALVYKETNSGMYGKVVDSLALLSSNILFHILNGLIFFIVFYFIVGLSVDAAGYFFLLIILVNWVLVSIGQLYALVSPNTEVATGISGITLFLSVFTMGFLITVSMMPAGWQWANQVNVLRYVLQGLVTNELAGTDYYVSLGGLGDLNFSEIGSMDLPTPQVVDTGEPGFEVVDFAACLVTHNCLKNPTRFGFCLSVTCASEFRAAIPKLLDAYSCFANNTTSTLNQQNDPETIECVLRAILPPQWLAIIALLVDCLVPIVQNLVVNNWQLPIPGDVILYYFGWSEVTIATEPCLTITFESNFLYWYCLFAIIMFLLGLESFKLFSARFITWIKR